MYFKASFTVEAAIIAPMAMIIFCWVILFAVNLHQEGKAELESYYESRIELTPTKSLRSMLNV